MIALLYPIIILLSTIGYWDACLAHQCPALVGLFHKQPCYDVLGFLVVSLGPDGCAERQQRAPSWIRGLLPSTSQYDIMVQLMWILTTGIHMETPRVSFMDCQDSWWWGEGPCLAMLTSCTGGRLVVLSSRLNLQVWTFFGSCRLNMFD